MHASFVAAAAAPLRGPAGRSHISRQAQRCDQSRGTVSASQSHQPPASFFDGTQSRDALAASSRFFVNGGRALGFFAASHNIFVDQSDLAPCAGRWTMMPMQVPKVVYKDPKGGDAQVVELWERLYKSRVIFVNREIDDEMANQMIAVLLEMDAEGQSNISIYINSTGGFVASGLAIYDTYRYIRSPIITVAVGTAASTASFLLAGGTKGKRYATPHSRIMIHQPRGSAEGQMTDQIIEARQVRHVKDELYSMYAEFTGQPLSRIAEDMERDKWMSAFEAKEYGIIDNVLLPREGK
eukprot:tig00000842_g4825.t1